MVVTKETFKHHAYSVRAGCPLYAANPVNQLKKYDIENPSYSTEGLIHPLGDSVTDAINQLLLGHNTELGVRRVLTRIVQFITQSCQS